MNVISPSRECWPSLPPQPVWRAIMAKEKRKDRWMTRVKLSHILCVLRERLSEYNSRKMWETLVIKLNNYLYSLILSNVHLSLFSIQLTSHEVVSRVFLQPTKKTPLYTRNQRLGSGKPKSQTSIHKVPCVWINFKTIPDFQHKVQAYSEPQFRKHHVWTYLEAGK